MIMAAAAMAIAATTIPMAACAPGFRPPLSFVVFTMLAVVWVVDSAGNDLLLLVGSDVADTTVGGLVVVVAVGLVCVVVGFVVVIGVVVLASLVLVLLAADVSAVDMDDDAVFKCDGVCAVTVDELEFDELEFGKVTGVGLLVATAATGVVVAGDAEAVALGCSL